MYISNVGEVLYLISRLDPMLQPLFGLNPETAHSRMAGLDYLWDAKLPVILAFDVKAPRTDRQEDITDILATSAAKLKRFWSKALKVDRRKIAAYRTRGNSTALAGYLARCLY